MSMRSLAAIPTTAAALISWFFRETITHWFFGKVVESVDSHVETLVEYGVPALFMAATLYLLGTGSDFSAVTDRFARRISLRDAASRLYTEFRGTTIGALMEGPTGTTAEGILENAAVHILKRVPLEVRHPPSTKWESLDPLAVGGLTACGGATGLRFVGHNDVDFPEVRLKIRDLKRLIREYQAEAREPARWGA